MSKNELFPWQIFCIEQHHLCSSNHDVESLVSRKCFIFTVYLWTCKTSPSNAIVSSNFISWNAVIYSTLSSSLVHLGKASYWRSMAATENLWCSIFCYVLTFNASKTIKGNNAINHWEIRLHLSTEKPLRRVSVRCKLHLNLG